MCRSCTASYIGKTYRHFKVKVSDNQGVSQQQVNQLKLPYQPVRDQMLVYNHKVVNEDFKFLGNMPNRYLLELKESLLIERDKSLLNENLYSQELLLFWVFHIG